MKRWELSILIGLVLSIALGGMTGFAQQCDAVRGDTIRLHIIANSDDPADQALKLKVRDAVLSETAEVFTHSASKEEAVAAARRNLVRIADTAVRTLRESGCDDTVTAQVTNMFFATRQYSDVMMPAGHYDTVRIVIGEGAGQNWWCVMFPPMCLPAAEAGEVSEEAELAQAKLIPAKPEFRVKFAVVELYEKAKEAFAQCLQLNQ